MIELTHRGDIAIVKMVHGKANALDIEFCEALATQFEALRSSDTKAVVLTGQGQMFSAGVNLIRLSEGGGSIDRPPPRLGERATEILAEAGYSEAEIAALRDDGVT